MDHAYGRSARYYDRIYGDKAYADEARALLRLIPDDAKTLLEVGCGTGGHLVHLREHLTCEGIDLSEEMLAVARDKLPDMPLAKADMRTFSLGRTFDVVASLFSATSATMSGPSRRLPSSSRCWRPTTSRSACPSCSVDGSSTSVACTSNTSPTSSPTRAAMAAIIRLIRTTLWTRSSDIAAPTPAV